MANAAQAFIAFLRVEASSSEERARSLRATAAAIEANAHDARGRKKRKREVKPKRPHTAYTLYVHENYEAIKKTHGADMPSKDIISKIAAQWSMTDDQEKQAWQFRADQLKEAQSHETNGIPGEAGLPSTEDWDKKQPARKAPAKSPL